MQIWFCQSCGARVTKADLGNVEGLSTTTLVYCKDCLKKENRAERTRQAAKLVAPEPVRPSSKGLRRKSTGKQQVPPPTPDPEPAAEDDEDELRSHRRARRSASNMPRAGSSKIRIATIAGVLLLITGIVLVNVNFNPAPTHISAPPRPVMGDQMDPTPAASTPLKAAVDEKAATAAYEKLDKDVAALPASEKKQKLALIDAYLAKWGDSIVSSRASNLRDKIGTPADRAPDVVPANPLAKKGDPEKAASKSSASAANELDSNRYTAAYTPMASPLVLAETRAQALLKAGDYKNAEIEFDRVLKQDPNNLDMLIGRADLGRVTEDYEACLTYSDKAATLSPMSYVPLALRAIAALALGKETLFKVDLAKAIQLCDQDLEYKLRIKNWVSDAGARGRVIVTGRSLEKREPKLASEFRTRGTYRYYKSRFADAEADLRKAIELDPEKESDYGFRTLVLICDFQNDPKQKLEACREWVKKCPQSANALNSLAWELLAGADETLRDAKAALPLIQHAAELDPSFSVLDTLALAWFNNNEVNKAIEIEKKAIALIPEDILPEDRAIYDQHLSQYELVKPADR